MSFWRTSSCLFEESVKLTQPQQPPLSLLHSPLLMLSVPETPAVSHRRAIVCGSAPGHMSRTMRKCRTDKFDKRNKRSFRSCNWCKRLGTSRLQISYTSQNFGFSRIEFICSKRSNFSAHVSGVSVSPPQSPHGGRGLRRASDRRLSRYASPDRRPWPRGATAVWSRDHADQAILELPGNVARQMWSPVLTASLSAVPAMLATVRARPGPFRPVKTASGHLEAVWRDRTGRDALGRSQAWPEQRWRMPWGPDCSRGEAGEVGDMTQLRGSGDFCGFLVTWLCKRGLGVKAPARNCCGVLCSMSHGRGNIGQGLCKHALLWKIFTNVLTRVSKLWMIGNAFASCMELQYHG